MEVKSFFFCMIFFFLLKTHLDLLIICFKKQLRYNIRLYTDGIF